MALRRIEQCPMAINEAHLFSTDDPNVIIEVILYPREILLDKLQEEIVSLESGVEPEILKPPTGASDQLLDAVSLYNMTNESVRNEVQQHHKLAQDLRALLNKIEGKRGR